MILLAIAAFATASIDVTPLTGFENAGSPSVARDSMGNVYVAFGQGKAIYIRLPERSEPVKVADGKSFALGMRRGPRLAIKGSTLVISAVGGEQGRGRDENLYAWRSIDKGRTWSGPATINDAPASAREGLHAMAAGKDMFAATWLDLRDKGTRLYMSTSRDGKTWSKNEQVYESPSGTICECCHPSIAFGSGDKPAIMWRNSLEGCRDMFLLTNPMAKAVKLGSGSWPLNACPMDGGAIAVDRDRLYTVWRREGQVYACEPGKPERQLGTGVQPWVAIGSRGPVYAWLRSSGGELVVLEPGSSEPRVVADRALDPVIASGLDQTAARRTVATLVWTDTSGGARIRRLDLG